MPRLMSEKAQAFTLDVDGGVMVPIMGNAALWTRPGAVPKGKLLDEAAARAGFTAGKVSVDLDQVLTGFAAVMFEDTDELSKA